MPTKCSLLLLVGKTVMVHSFDDSFQANNGTRAVIKRVPTRRYDLSSTGSTKEYGSEPVGYTLFLRNSKWVTIS